MIQNLGKKYLLLKIKEDIPGLYRLLIFFTITQKKKNLKNLNLTHSITLLCRFVKKASSSLMKHMAQLEAAGLVKHSSDTKDETADVDIDFYITSVSALLKLIQVKCDSMILLRGNTFESDRYVIIV